jgi:2-polyprenyl-6-methoxyphenol hydroxylase-like FAD-dependent oxidoreductase
VKNNRGEENRMASGIYDIITVGGGPGGSSLARVMAKHGARVLVLERETEFRDRVRGEAMPSWGTAQLKDLGLYELLQDTCGHELPWLEIFFGPHRIAHRNLIATTPRQTPFYTFYHPAMQEVLLQAAADAGAEVRRGVRATDIQPGTPPSVVVEEKGQTEVLSARLVVGADGRNSFVRQSAGFTVQRDPERLCLSGVLFDSMPTPGHEALFRFNLEIGQMAFLFPQRDGRVRAYVAHQKASNYRLSGHDQLPRFIEASVQAGAPAELFEGARAVGPLATFDGADHWVEHPYREGVALVGDAAATSDPSWGEGLSLTTRDVLVLQDRLRSDDDWDAAGHAYAEEHDRHYGVVHTVDNWLSEFLMGTGPEAVARRERALPLIAEDGTRMPDLFALGPETPATEGVRRRFYGEE